MMVGMVLVFVVVAAELADTSGVEPAEPALILEPIAPIGAWARLGGIGGARPARVLAGSPDLNTA